MRHSEETLPIHIPTHTCVKKVMVHVVFFFCSYTQPSFTGCCPGSGAQGPSSCAVVTWMRPVWSGRGMHLKMSRCPRRQIQKEQNKGEELGEPSSSPKSLHPVLFSWHLLLPSPPPPRFLHRPPRLVGAPFVLRPPQERGYLEAPSQGLDLLPLPSKPQQHRRLRLSLQGWFGKPRTPEPRPSSHSPRARTHRVNGEHRWMTDLCCPEHPDSG